MPKGEGSAQPLGSYSHHSFCLCGGGVVLLGGGGVWGVFGGFVVGGWYGGADGSCF